jgi:hypothetical protein
MSVWPMLDPSPRYGYSANLHLQNGDAFPCLTSVRHPVGDVPYDKSTVAAASWSRTVARGGIPRYGITRRGCNNDRLSTLWREVISLAGVARSFSSGGG